MLFIHAFCGFYHNCNVENIFTMTLHAGLAKLHISVKFHGLIWLREFNLKKKLKNFDLTHFPMQVYRICGQWCNLMR